MSQKYVIGLTGNIATGKSIVRRMLQELGASTVDADSLVHVLQQPGTVVYREIVETFGTFVLNKDSTINRKRLGEIVFSSAEALQVLENLTHPRVRQQLERAISRAPTYVIVIEAIKLIEGGLAEKCDAIWVVDSTEDTQMVRLMTKRHMSSQEALRRIRIQSSQADKLARADVIIANNGDLVATWNQVQQKMNEIPKPTAAPSVAEPTATATVEPTPEAAVVEIRRAKRGDLSQMADIIAAATQKEMMLEEGDMMERLFSKGYLVAQQQDEIVGLIGWQTENLIAGIDDFFLKDSALWQSVGDELIRQVEKAVSELSCEVGLIFLHNKTGPSARSFLENHGYKEKKAEELDKMWREAAQEWAVDNTTLMVKPLLERRIMTPI